jgi:hypothetical protein
MHSLAIRRQALAALTEGQTLAAVTVSTGIARSTLRDRLAQPEPPPRHVDCPRCGNEAEPPTHDYVYLLGMYLGDGCISEAPRTTALRISCDDHWPGIMTECEAAIRAVSSRPVYRVASVGCHDLTALWKHWPCLFPQHGPGKKHNRIIRLEAWQRDLVAADPRPLIRGLTTSGASSPTPSTS